MSGAPARRGVPTKHVLKAVMTSDLDQESRHIMHVLAFVADYQTSELPPQFTPSTAQLALQTGLSKSTVIRRRTKLEADGWITVKRPTPEETARRVRIRYWLAIPAAGAHRAHAAAAERLIQGLADSPEAADDGYLSDSPTGFTVNPPEDSPWLPTGVPQTSEGVSPRHPEAQTGVPQTPRRVSRGHLDGYPGDTSKNYLPFQQEPEKPPAVAGGREQRLATAEELTEKFWTRHGTASAQRRPAVRSVIITAIADNGVPRDDAAWALDALARAGKQITPDSLTAALARMRPADPARAAPASPPPAPRPPRRFCQIRDHAQVELTESGLCPNCAADARIARDPADTPDALPGHIPPPRRAHHNPDDTQLITRQT